MRTINSILIFYLICLSSLFAGDNYWTQVEGTNIAYITDIAIDPANPNNVYFGGYNGDYGVFRSTDGGETFQQITDLPIGVSTCSIAISPSSTNILYISFGWNSPAAIYKSENYGINWLPADNGLETGGIGIAVDPIHSDTVYFAATYPYKSIDGGENWFMSGEGVTNYYCIDIVINPINPDIVYLCSTAQFFPAMIYKSINGAENWEEKANGLPASYFDIHHLAINPINSEIIYAGVSGYDSEQNPFVTVYKTVNGGESWLEIGEGLEVISSAPACIAIDPLRPQIIFSGFTQGYGVYRSTNEGENWENFNVGLPEYEIKALAVSPTTPPTIFAGTVSHGLWVYTDTTVGIDEQNIEIIHPINFLHQNYPNPFNPETTISFNLNKEQEISLTLYNIKGEKIKNIFEGRAGKGKSSYNFKSNDLASGIYFYKLKTEKEELVKKCLLMK